VIILKKVLTLLLYTLLLLSLISSHSAFADDFNEGIACISLNNNLLLNSKPPVIGAIAAIVIDADSGRVLYEKNAYSRRAIASTTKIMTAIVALENGNLDDIVTISKSAAVVGGSSINLQVSEKLKLSELLYGLLLNSGNDAAVAIAEHIGGTVEKFSDMMNKKAMELGAKDSHFLSPHGLDKDGHYSTAYDLALITKYALKNTTFCKIVSTKSTTIYNRSLYNTNEMLELYPGADGVKTGYTGQAGRCLVTTAKRDNMRIISVVLNCGSRTIRAQSSKNILDFAYENYEPYILLRQRDVLSRVRVIKGVRLEVPLVAAAEIKYPLSKEEISEVKTQVSMPNVLFAPVNEGTVEGKIKFLLKGKVIGEALIKAGAEVVHKSFGDYLREIAKTWVESVKNIG